MSDIFIQIASYRDPELPATVESAIRQADHPERLSFGIVWQGKQELDPLPLDYLKYCRLLMIDSDRSRGVCWARSKAQSLWDGEPYTLQIDSHMRFVRGWDSLLMHMLHQCPTPKPILTAYPPAYIPPDQLLVGEPTTLGASHFNEQGILSLVSRLSLAYQIRPQLGLFMAAGFWFGSSLLIQEVPYDPSLYFLGEEINLTVRAWTQGWDVYHPNQIICYHEYTRPGKPRHWEDHTHWWQQNQIALHRLRQLLGIEDRGMDLHPYGLGTVRSLSGYEAFAGLSFGQQQLSDAARNGIPEGLSQTHQFTNNYV